MQLRYFALSFAALAGCDAWIAGDRTGQVTVETCPGGHVTGATEVRCAGGWRRSAPPSANLAAWRPPGEPLRLSVREHRGRYEVSVEGAVRCRFDAPVASKQAVGAPTGAACQRAGRALRVDNGWFSGAGGTYAPSYLQVSMLLSDADGVVRLDGQLHRPR
jgi:hypothetical protein